jgi:hypothetical protein
MSFEQFVLPMTALPSLELPRLLVSGDAKRRSFATVASVLDSLAPVAAVAHRGRPGADRMAGRWAKKHGIEPAVYGLTAADWRPDGVFDPKVGRKRNLHVLRDFRPDWVVVFKLGFDHRLRSGDVEHLVEVAREARVGVSVIDWLI